MVKYFSLLIVIVSLILVYSCQSNVNQQTQDSSQIEVINNKPTSATTVEKEQITTQSEEVDEQLPTDDEIQEYGIIVGIEDGPYPMFIITMEFPRREMKIDFNLNVETISQDMAAIYDLKGKYVRFYYLSDMVNDLTDLHINDVTLFGEWAPEFNPQWKSITGKLSGAETETVSDLPGEIYVNDETGRQISFELYIDSEVVNANGKVVTAYYSMRGVNTITYIAPGE